MGALQGLFLKWMPPLPKEWEILGWAWIPVSENETVFLVMAIRPRKFPVDLTSGDEWIQESTRRLDDRRIENSIVMDLVDF